jgi:hypothetical protein
MLNILGKSYIIDNYVAFFLSRKEEKEYRTYVTDSLRCLTRNTANKEGDLTINLRFYDLAYDSKDSSKKEEIENQKDANEIVLNLKEKLKKLGGEKP